MSQKNHHRHGHSPHAVPKTVALAIAVALMLPIANSWQQLSGSIRDFVGSVVVQEVVAK